MARWSFALQVNVKQRLQIMLTNSGAKCGGHVPFRREINLIDVICRDDRELSISFNLDMV